MVPAPRAEEMPAAHNACFSPASFSLTGIPQLEAVHGWLSIPFCALYALAVIGLVATLRGFLYICPLPLLVRRFTRYHSNVIAHSYCEHMAVVMLSCEDISVSNIYGMTIGFVVLTLDSLCIGLSYAFIFQAVMRLATVEARLKTFSTCSSHICAILAFYVPIAVSSLTHRFGHSVAPSAHILLANFYLLIPPVLNPVVYAARTREIRRSLAKVLSCRR
ncbi:hypothetical protein lerEdw1_005824 [Lerista edwardsae]|nr:hypothetical protein lerEdw1_005824 [Lerista edwardsae]